MLYELNDVIHQAGLDLNGVRLARHSRDGLAQRRRHVRYFDDYVSIQPQGNLSRYNGASIAFQFIPGPTLADWEPSVMFARAHRVSESWERRDGDLDHCPSLPDPRHRPSAGLLAYDWEILPDVGEYSSGAGGNLLSMPPKVSSSLEALWGRKRSATARHQRIRVPRQRLLGQGSVRRLQGCPICHGRCRLYLRLWSESEVFHSAA
ncbi:hypothetical protein Poly30_27780 [Planctomycetes bacterium Poly30]|uniref:Uncharacterized protein n=1 Tax=Saltatorellus ferox TaxID=2528018 RepID=A0A518ET43_9BACT|nr:hypothetical protein Poly30_27780 [Planctomycetes bacterium Poly30]